MASGDGPDVTAISIAHYPAVAANYRLFSHGGSVGRGYGPVLVGGPGARVGVPGLTTTAFLVLRMAMGEFEPVVIPIAPPSLTFDALRRGEVDSALLIHEGRLTYAREGFPLILDIGAWWHGRTGLPLPLGGNVIRRSLGDDVIGRASAAIRDSIAWGLSHREEAIAWLLARGGPLSTAAMVDEYLSLYANQDSLDYGEDGRAAIELLLARGAEMGALGAVGGIDWA
jgi:1,4-dihydroxy-6-naphthoate synthase